MILLTTTNATTPTAIYSGLIAALVSGVVALIGYGITAFVQSKNGKKAIEAQKEIAQMQRDEKLFYESQLDWANETRKLIAKFATDCFKLNILIRKINDLEEKVEKKKFSVNDRTKLLTETANHSREAEELITELHEQVTLIRLYLFRDDEEEGRVLATILTIEHGMNLNGGVDSKVLNQFIDITRNYFDKLMKRLKEESA